MTFNIDSRDLGENLGGVPRVELQLQITTLPLGWLICIKDRKLMVEGREGEECRTTDMRNFYVVSAHRYIVHTIPRFYLRPGLLKIEDVG